MGGLEVGLLRRVGRSVLNPLGGPEGFGVGNVHVILIMKHLHRDDMRNDEGQCGRLPGSGCTYIDLILEACKVRIRIETTLRHSKARITDERLQRSGGWQYIQSIDNRYVPLPEPEFVPLRTR